MIMTWQKGHSLKNGEYLIQQKLGEGGFGVTYLAMEKHNMLGDRTVVIKTPNDTLQNNPEYDKFVKRFIKEGTILYQLGEKRHPHIVRVTDLFTEGNLPCLIMDFIEGESLYDLVRNKGKLSEAKAVKYIQQIGSALEIVHQENLVHRDAHPGNIIIPPNQQAILIDFGIVGDIFPTTMSSKAMGNPAFAPFEQFTGARNPTVDIYTLSASLYYAVTGAIPQRDQYSNELILPKQINPRLSDQVNRAISQGMAIQPKNRPQTMGEFLILLDDVSRNKNSSFNTVKQSVNKSPQTPPTKVALPPQPLKIKSQGKQENPIRKENNPPYLQKVNFPWFCLFIIAEVYIMIGYFCATIEGVVVLAVVLAVFGVVVLAVFGVVRGVVRGTVILAFVLTVVLAVVLAVFGVVGWVVGGAISSIVGLAVFGIVGLAVFSAVRSAVEALDKQFFNRLEIALIILGACGIGFGLGWMVFWFI